MEGLIRQAYRRYDFAASVAAVGLAAAASIWLTRYACAPWAWPSPP